MASNKCTEKMGTNVPQEFADEFNRRAHQAGCTPSELLRDLICLNLHGITWGEHINQDRRAALRVELIHVVKDRRSSPNLEESNENPLGGSKG